MYSEERQQKILEYIKHKKKVSVKSLKNMFYVSEATIRRDLSKLEEKHTITRTHGGAILAESDSVESSLLQRLEKNIKEKRLIGAKAAHSIKPYSHLFLDSSSTIGHMIYQIKDAQHMVCITNGLNNALLLSRITKANVIIPGGNVYSKTNSVLGIHALDDIAQYYCDAFIFSCSGLDLEGIYEASDEQRAIKQKMHAQSRKHILLVDHSKFNQRFLAKTFDYKDIDVIITNYPLTDSYVKLFHENNIETIVVQ